MKFEQVLDLVVEQTTNLGYRQDAIRRDYAYSDVSEMVGGTHRVPLVAFSQTPPSYRSAAFAVAEGSFNRASNIVESHRSLGAPLFFVVDNDKVSTWQVYARQTPRLIERFYVAELSERFAQHREEWGPDSIYRAKSIGRVDKKYQLSFVDVGLIPAIEGEIHTRLDRMIREAVAHVRKVTNNEAMRLLFRGVFRLLAAKILTDREHPRPKSWEADSVADVLSSMGDYYSLGNDTQVWPANTLALLEPVWATFRSGFNVANISADDLAYVYESTLVNPQARANFGTHSTPRHVADYILDRFRLWEFGAAPPKVYEPFAGAGVFLGSALRQMRDGLPHDWTDEQRHELLVKHISGAEIDSFACEVAKLSLILADYPNANGWHIENTDLFKKGVLATRLKGADVVLCNPPFEVFNAKEKARYPDAAAIDGSKAVMTLETALRARPNMLGFVVPNTLLLDRRYRHQRRTVERLYREVELVSLPDGVFNVSQLDTALLIARDLRGTNERQIIRSSAVYDADKKTFAVDRKPSHCLEEVRTPKAAGDGRLWLPPLQHVWTVLADLPTLETKVRGHWGLRWRGGQTEASRFFDRSDDDRAAGFMYSSSLDQFVLGKPGYLDVRPSEIYAGLGYDWDAPKILTNAGRLGRGYWRLAAAVDRGGRRASQQFIGFWPAADAEIDLDAIAALINGPVVNAFVAEHSFDKRFRIGSIERAPIPTSIPESLGDLSRAYAAAAARSDSDPDKLASLLAEIDTLVLDAYELHDDLKRDLLAAIGSNWRPVRGLASRRRSRKPTKPNQRNPMPMFPDFNVEEAQGEGLGRALSATQASAQLQSIAKVVPVERWAGQTLSASDLKRERGISRPDLAAWERGGSVISFVNQYGERRYPGDQFVGNRPVAGLAEIIAAIVDPRVAWRWLSQPHSAIDQRRPIEILKTTGIEALRSLVARDFQ